MIYLGSDHGGFKLKAKVMQHLKEKKISFTDLGNVVYDPDDDYPTYAFLVAEHVARRDDHDMDWNKRDKGILFCRSSAGMVIAANKVRGARAVSVFDEKSARHSREHNDSNIIAISGDWSDLDVVKKIIDAWLTTPFSKEARHIRRLDQIRDYEVIK